jgi:hypothetical protein
MKSAKDKITQLVVEYTRLFPKEFDSFKKSTASKIESGTQWGETDHTDVIQRHLFDKPEVLHHSLHRALSEREWDWLHARGEFTNNFEGPKWFIKTFPAFKITKDF